ncbi:unnamed protein product, partial [Prorocentrum cordatum]
MQNARTMPDLETFRQQRASGYLPSKGAADPPISRWHVPSSSAGHAGPAELQGAADPPRPRAHAGASEGLAGHICFGGSAAATGGGGARALQGGRPLGLGQPPGAAEDARGRLQEVERALDEREAQVESLLGTSQELLALVKGLQGGLAQPSESTSRWQRDVVSRAEQAIRQAALGSGGPGVRPAAAAGTLSFATDRA